MVSKNREHYSILTHCMMEWLRAGPYNGKTTLNCEYRIIHTHKKKKKARKELQNQSYGMYSQGRFYAKVL